MPSRRSRDSAPLNERSHRAALALNAPAVGKELLPPRAVPSKLPVVRFGGPFRGGTNPTEVAGLASRVNPDEAEADLGFHGSTAQGLVTPKPMFQSTESGWFGLGRSVT